MNSKGEFNVPFGRYRRPVICDVGKLGAASAALQGVEIQVADFEATVATAARSDFVYFDPPYVPLSKTASFTAYAARQFGAPEQARLANLLRALGRGAVPALLSTDSRITRDLYSELDCRRVPARRSINSVARGRGPIRRDPGAQLPYPFATVPRD